MDKADTIVERMMIRWRGEPDPKHVKAIDAYFVSAAEHGMNASTFTSRVVASTGADAGACISSAIGALSGPLHGGAPSRVLKMLDDVEREGDADKYVKGLLDSGQRLMGFGHRVYRAEDPRARVLRRTAKELGSRRYEVAEQLEKAALAELKVRQPDRVLATNVEFWSAVVLDFAEVPAHMFTSMFTCARTAGWSAHVLEQKRTGRLIRPSARYIGPATRKPEDVPPALHNRHNRWQIAGVVRVASFRDGSRRSSDSRRACSRRTAGSVPGRPRCAPRRWPRWPRPDAACSGPRTGRRRYATSSARFVRGSRSLFGLPEGYEVLLGNGGATAFWDAAAFGLVRQRSQHLVFGEFSSKFADVHPRRAVPGRPVGGVQPTRATHPEWAPEPGIDAYCTPHNETSTGVARSGTAAGRRRPGALHLVDATSGAGGLPVDADRGRRLLLRAAEVLRVGRRALAGADVAGRHRADRRRSATPTLGAGVVRPRHRARQQPARPDVQHSGAGHAFPAGRPDRAG